MTTGALSRTANTALPPSPPLPVAVQTVLFARYRDRWLPRLRRRYGDIIYLRLYPQGKSILLANPDDIKTVFTGPATVFHAGEGNVLLKPVMGEHSVLTTDEDEHLRIRKLLMPAFHGAALRGYREMMTELAEREVRHWPIGRAFPTHSRMSALTLEIILRVVFGVAEGPRLDELRRRVGRMVDITVLDILGGTNEKLLQYGRWRRIMDNQRRVDELLYAEIAERRRASDLAERTDVLSRLLTVDGDGGQLTDVELRDQLVTLLLAGHETTATALAWAFHELSRDPVHLTAAAEAASVGDEKYLEAVVKEAMRLHPVVPEVARKLTEDTEIGGYRIPAGFVVMPSIVLVHADSGLHPDPQRFRPERFLTGGGPAPGSWFPFGGGVRRCLGAGFSLLEATIVLREVLTRYRILPAGPREAPRPRNVTIVPSRGARIMVVPRPGQ